MRTSCYHDFDAFAESIHGVESKMLLRNPNRRTWTLNSGRLGELEVQVGRLGSGNIAQGELRSDGYMLYQPLTDGVEYSANGVVMERDSFAILEPGCEFCISTKVEHDWCAVTVPTQVLAQGDDAEAASINAESSTVRVTVAHRQVANRYRELTGQIMSAAAACARFEAAPAAKVAEEELLELASQVIGQRHAGEARHEGRPRVSREQIIRCCNQLLEEREGEPVRVGDLATAAAVAERTLRTAFNEYFGVGPVRYLQLRQLHQLHRALKAAEPESESVADVLVAHGVWEFSRFAARYRRLFGELPSETLRALRR